MNNTLPLARSMSEADLQRNVIALAQTLGWLVHHQRPGLDRRGRWSSQLQGNPGFFDLFLARRGDIILAELKSEKGKLSAEQELWAGHCYGYFGNDHTRVKVFTWRPSDWFNGTIEEALK